MLELIKNNSIIRKVKIKELKITLKLNSKNNFLLQTTQESQGRINLGFMTKNNFSCNQTPFNNIPKRLL